MAESDPLRDLPSAEMRSDHLPAISPDEREQELVDQIDNIIPTRGYAMRPMVALGGSAGSIPAIQAFLQSTPLDSGVSYVVILHLQPDRDSSLASLLQSSTRMPVHRAENLQKVEANSVYVIPPGKHLTVVDDWLHLTPLEPEHGRRVAVDLFFRSMADTHGAHSVAVVLSGADGDGAIGLKRVKERGGLTIAQDPDEAQHDGMPRSAIATGMVDWVLEAGQMPSRITEYFRRGGQMKLPPEEGPQPAVTALANGGNTEAALREVLVFLRTRTGRDFTYYKRATILRRVSRRMQVNGLDDLPSYLSYLRTHPGEAGALLKDLLISVTNFFRDREAFETLESHIPSLFEGKTQNDVVRVWVPACATGEEAYSIAILLMEHARKIDFPPAIQVFGCDLDEDAVQMARAGVYPESISADVSEERLRRWFVREHRGYRVRREVREVLLFAAHDLLKDAPFSRMDLVSCRNLLIYLSREAQARALDIFHFALRPSGLLFLGSSESVDDETPLYSVVHKKHRLYVHRPFARVGLPVPTGPSPIVARLAEQHGIPKSHAAPVLPGPSFAPLTGPVPALATSLASRMLVREEDRRISWGELHYKMIERFAPPSVVVTGDHEIVHMSEKAGQFMQISGGQPTTNLLRLVRPELRIELRGALFRAAQASQTAEAIRIPLELNGEARLVNLQVHPAQDLAPDFFLINFELVDPHQPLADRPERSPRSEAQGPDPISQQLEHELEHLKSHLRDTVEQYEASTEELKASNEELQAMNEELRSATEELETSREELQSINEELTTVNAELKSKVEELGNTNSVLHNLMSSTAIATVFLDRELRIMRYTPTAAPIFNLIPSDEGRPLSDLKHRLEYPELTADADRVLAHLVPVEREVPASDGGTYLARLLPYRTLEDHIGGVVVNFVDITERKRAEAELRARADELERFNRAAVGRELRMIELKTEVNNLLARLQEPARYNTSPSEEPPDS